MAATLSRSEIARGEQSFDLPGVGWDQYVAVNDILADRPGVRMIYLDGSLTFLTLSRRHDWHSDFLDAIVKAVASVCGIEWEVAGSATFRRDLDAGLEADRAYYFGPNAEVMAGPVNVNLATQPPPDLAIEVEVSRSAVKALAIYARMGVPEVWRLDVGRGTLAFLARDEAGVYQPVARSKNLPALAPDDVLSQLRLAEEMGSASRWYAQLPEWVRATLMRRLGG